MAEPIDEFVAHFEPPVQAVLRRLHRLIRETWPDAHEGVDRGNWVLRYGTGAGMRDMVLYLAGHKAHARLGFARGASLPDPEGLIEGTGKNMRHVKVRSVEEAERPALRQLIEAAKGTG